MDTRDRNLPVVSSGNAGALTPYQPGSTREALPPPKPKVAFWWPMRGRWKLAALTTLTAAALLGLLGYATSTVRYAAEGRVDTQLLATGYPDQGSTDPELIRGVLEREAGQIERLGAGFDVAMAATARPPVGLSVRVSADSAAAADDALRRTLERYERDSALHGEVARAAEARVKLDALNALLGQRDAVQRQIDTLNWTDDGTALPALLEQRQRELSLKQSKLDEMERWRSQLDSVAVGRQTAVVVLAESDPQVAKLLIERASLVVKILGGLAGEDADKTRSLQSRWVELNEQIDAIADDTRVMPASWVGAPHDEHRLVAIRLGELDKQQAATRRELNLARESLTQLQDRHRLLRERQDAWRTLDTAVQAAQHEFAAVADRPALVLKLLGTAAEPVADSPVADNRPGRTLLGALLGALLGFGGVMAVAWTDPKVRRPDPEPWTTRDAPLVGVVPEVNTGQSDAGAALSDAGRRKMQQDLSRLADAVHAIRAVVEAQLGSETAKMICVTSAAPHSGKTSLTVGLASSLVMGGMKVLVVDAALTDRVARATEDAAGVGGAQSLDQVMIGMEFLDAEDRDLLAFPEDEPVGLGAYLHGTPLEQAEIRTRIPGLGLLSGVGVRAGDSGRLSSTFFRRLGHEASSRYDVVLLDTGSIPRCVEALFIAGASDGTLLVVGRHENRRAVDVALQRLRLVGARLLGTVFNRDQAAPDPRGAAGTGSTIDPSWRDQGSGMFAAAVRTHGGQSGVFEPEKGQTGMYPGQRRPPPDEPVDPATVATSGSSVGSSIGMGPIDFAADGDPTPRPRAKAKSGPSPANANANEDSAADPSAATAAGDEPILLENDTTNDEHGDGSFIDRYIDAVLDSAAEDADPGRRAHGNGNRDTKQPNPVGPASRQDA